MMRLPQLHGHALTACLMAAALVACGSTGYGQLPTARLAGIFPAGAQQGTTVEITIAGEDLDDCRELLFSHPGIKAEPKMREPKVYEEGPQPEQNTFVVTVAQDVPLGKHSVRAAGKYGLSNPRVFVVDELPEVLETEPNNKAEEAMEIAPGSVVQARSDRGTDLDWYRFTAKKGQSLIIECWAEQIDSRLQPMLTLYNAQGDELDRSRYTWGRDTLIDFTAPADGQYLLQVRDFVYGGGNDYMYRLVLDSRPHVDFVFPAAGPVGQKAKFTLYGRNLPGGKTSPYKLDGRPLQSLEATIQVPGSDRIDELDNDTFIKSTEAGIDGFAYRLPGPQGKSNPVLIGFAQQKQVFESEPNNKQAQAQAIELPCEVQGQFYPGRDKDRFRFDAKQGDTFWIQVLSQQLGSPADPYLLVQQIVKNDDGEIQYRDIKALDDPETANNMGGYAFFTMRDDPSYRFVAPADGEYLVTVSDLYGGAQPDPRSIYRLIIRPETPDFRIVAAPRVPSSNPRTPQGDLWSAVLRRGGNELIEVYAYRRDGFDGPIEVTAQGLPRGVTAQPAVIGPGQSSATIVLSADDKAPVWKGTINVEATAQINGKTVKRPARFGTVMYKPANNTPGPARLCRDLGLSVIDAEQAPYQVKVTQDKVLETARGGKLTIPLQAVRRGNFKGNLTLVPANVPSNGRAGNATIAGNKSTGTAEITLPNNATPGEYTFYLLAQSSVSYSRNPEAVAEAKSHQDKLKKLITSLDKESKDAEKNKSAKADMARKVEAEAKQAADQLAAATKAATDIEDDLSSARETLAKAEAALQDEPEDEKRQTAVASAEKEVAELEKKLAEAEKQLAAAKKTADAAAQALTEAQAAAKKAEEEAAQAAARLKEANDAQRTLDNEVRQLEQAGRARNINLYRPSTLVRVKVYEMPFEADVRPPSGKLKQGDKLTLLVKLTRLLNYADQVEVTMAPPGGVSLIAPKLTIGKGKNSGELEISAADNCRGGEHEVTLRFSCRFNNQTLTLEQKLPITIEEAVKSGK